MTTDVKQGGSGEPAGKPKTNHYQIEEPHYDDSALDYGVQEVQAIINGVEINYVKVGTGPTNILCIPGTLGYWVDFAPLFSVFDLTKYTLVAFDPPGYGKSIPPERKYNIQTNHNDAKQAYGLMKELKLLPFAILGWSEGMRTGTLICVQQPKAVTKCITWGGAAYITAYHAKFWQMMRDVDQWPDREAAKRFETKYGMSYFRKIWAAQADFYINVFNAVPNGNLIFDVLDKVNTPYLLIYCGKDTMTGEGGRQQAEKIVKKVRRGRLLENANGTHDVHLKQSEWFVKTVTDFLSEESSPTGNSVNSNNNTSNSTELNNNIK